MQKFYRTFSVTPERSAEPCKGKKVTAIAACLEKKIVDSERVKLNSDNVQKFLNKVNVSDSQVKCNSVLDKQTKGPLYENVFVNGGGNTSNTNKKLSLEENKGYSSIYENITILTPAKAPETKEIVESKLHKALESFDKILSEFSTCTSLTPGATNFVPPKLQKSKTCSIIESRCILKKCNSDSQSDNKISAKVVRNNSIDKTTSLWNLDDMKGKELTAPLIPLTPTLNEKNNVDRYATYKISSKQNVIRPIKTEDLKKLDVKTRILKKTLSNPPSTPVPVVLKSRSSSKKVERKSSDPKKPKTKTDNTNAREIFGNKEVIKSQIQKAKSVWEIGNEILLSSNLERARSSTSIAGSPSKIPVIRGVMSQNKFSSTRALFSPTPVDLNNVDQARECAQKKKINAPKKCSTDKSDTNRTTKQKSQLNLKADTKRPNDKTKKESIDKKPVSSPKTPRDYSEELNAVRAKLQLRKINNNLTPDTKRKENALDIIDSPVKSIVKKLELKTALETNGESGQFVSCKVIPPVHKELCVANTTFHNHLSTLVGRQIKCVEALDDVKICAQNPPKQTYDKISDTHSDCSDDSGHVSNDGVEEECLRLRLEVEAKSFGIDLPGNAKAMGACEKARGSGNEVASGTIDGDAPKVAGQVHDTVYISISANCRCYLSGQVLQPLRSLSSPYQARSYKTSSTRSQKLLKGTDLS